MNPEEIVAMLRQGIVAVAFHKSDGSQGEMECTLHPSKLPPRKPGTTPRPPKSDLIVCWSVDDDGWRSFKPSRLTAEPNLIVAL
jgi:hypothetical protein